MEWHGAVPHIGGKEHQPSGPRLNGAADRIFERDTQGRLAELDPALAALGIRDRGRQGDIVTGTDPTLWVDMVGVKAAVAQPRRPGASIVETLGLPGQERVPIVRSHVGYVAADRFPDTNLNPFHQVMTRTEQLVRCLAAVAQR